MSGPIKTYPTKNTGVGNHAEVTGTDVTGSKRALDVNVSNDLPIEVVISGQTTGTVVADQKTVTNLGAGLTDDHDYTTAATSFTVSSVHASASGLIKVEVFQNGTLIDTAFQSTGSPFVVIDFSESITLLTGETFTVRIENREAVAQNVYSTIYGEES